MILIIVGIVSLAIEMCIPGFGVFGIIGIFCLFGAIVSRAIEGANVTQICIMIILCLAVVILFFIIISHSMQKGFLSKTGLVETGEAVKKGFVSPKEELVGKIGTTKSPCRPAGSVVIEENEYDCMSRGKYINANEKVKVVKIKDDNILIERVEDK